MPKARKRGFHPIPLHSSVRGGSRTNQLPPRAPNLPPKLRIRGFYGEEHSKEASPSGSPKWMPASTTTLQKKQDRAARAGCASKETTLNEHLEPKREKRPGTATSPTSLPTLETRKTNDPASPPGSTLCHARLPNLHHRGIPPQPLGLHPVRKRITSQRGQKRPLYLQHLLLGDEAQIPDFCGEGT